MSDFLKQLQDNAEVANQGKEHDPEIVYEQIKNELTAKLGRASLLGGESVVITFAEEQGSPLFYQFHRGEEKFLDRILQHFDNLDLRVRKMPNQGGLLAEISWQK